MKLKQSAITTYFDEGASGRPLMPDALTLSGWGKVAKYAAAARFVERSGAQLVLDLGCSVGHLAGQRRTAGSPFIVGIDMSLASLKRASDAALPAADFAAADGLRLPFPSHTFDLIVCLDVLEHLAPHLALIQEIYRVLKPGGQFYLTTPNPHCIGSYLGYRLYRALRAMRGRPPVDKDRFVDCDQMTTLARTAGFYDGRGQRQDVNGHLVAYFLPRPFIALKGWVVTPPLPPRWAVRYQRLWVRLLGLRLEKLPRAWRDRLGHTLTAELTKP